MLTLTILAQVLLLVESVVLSAMVTVRTRSVVKGTLCLYGLSLLWVLLFAYLAPWGLPQVMEVDLQEIDEVFPTHIRVFPVLLLGWIPAFVVASLMHLAATVANDFLPTPDMRTSANSLKRCLARVFVGLTRSLRRRLTPARDRPYPKWVGVVLGLVLSGSAHFLSGRKRAGLLWYATFLVCNLVGIVLLLLTGRWALFSVYGVWLVGVGLWLVMLVKSYRPARRIGWHGWLALICVSVCLNAVTKSAARLAVHPFSIPSGAMAPTIVAGDYVTAEKMTYRFREPRRGEIVVFRTDGIERLRAGQYFTFRVVGLPGERISIDPPHLVIDGKKVTDPPIFESIASGQGGYGGYVPSRQGYLDTKGSEFVLGEDQYFVIGDDAVDAYDSRYWGAVPRENIIGRVTRIYWPLDRIGALEGKW